MARTGKLSAIEVTKAKGPAVLHDGGGLYLRVSATGSKSWVFRFQIDGKRRDMGLGPYPDISLAEARGKAAEHRKQRHEGMTPSTRRPPSGKRSGFPSRRAELSGSVPSSSSERTGRAGATPSTGSSGRTRSPPTSTPFWGNCRSRRSMPGWSFRRLIRSGRRSPKPQAACAAASRRFSTPRRCAVSGRGRTRRNGRATSRTFSRRAPRCGRSRTMPRYPSTICPNS